MFDPQHRKVQLPNGLDAHLGNFPSDGLWQIRSIRVRPQITGALNPTFETGKQTGSGDSGLRLIHDPAPLPMPNGWTEKTFTTADEAESFVMKSYTEIRA